MVAYSFKRRFVDPIRAGTKRQTIREDRKRHARPGEEMQLYHGMRTKHCFLISKVHCRDLRPITLVLDDTHPKILIGGSPYNVKLDEFAHEDGFANWKDMHDFWREHHPGVDRFDGVIIRWEPIT